MKKFRLVGILLLITQVAGLALADERFMPTGITNHLHAAQLGMGGITTVARGHNAHAVFYNPALLNHREFDLDISLISGGLDDDAVEVIDFIDAHQNEFDDFEELTFAEQNRFIMDSQQFDNKWVSVALSPFSGMAIENIGTAVYSVILADVKVDHGVFIPAVGMRGYQDNVLGFGLGLPIKLTGKEINFGFSLRFIERRTFKPLRVSAADADELDQVIETSFDEFEKTENGFGFDIGLIHTLPVNLLGWNTDLDIGIVAQDLIGVLDSYMIPNINIGAITPLPASLSPLNCDVAVEFTDLFNRQGVGLVQRLNLGAEKNILSNIISLRCGLHQGYPTFGLGLKLLFIEGDYAYFTRELGTRPGQFAESTHRLQLGLDF